MKDQARSAFTLIEVMVVLAVVGLVCALTLPAVQAAREAARKISCLNNMRQLGLATNSYMAAFNRMPTVWLALNQGQPDDVHNSRNPTIRHFSIFSQILPWIEKETVYNQINFGVDVYDSMIFGAAHTSPENSTTMGIHIKEFVCPSDPVEGNGSFGGVNYRANWGSARWGDAPDSPFTNVLRQIIPADITDGLSHTAAYSEKLKGGLKRPAFNRFTDMTASNIDNSYSSAQYLSACEAIPDPPQAFHSEAGLSWFIGSLSQTLYNHMDNPNSFLADCGIGGTIPILGSFTARSYHPGVNTAFCDGSARFISNPVGFAVWHALGTRNGGEVADGF